MSSMSPNEPTGDQTSATLARLLAEQLKFSAEQFKLYAEGHKFAAEQRKLNAEVDKLAAERQKLLTDALKTAREHAWYPVVLMIAALGAGAALAKLLA